MTFREDTSGLRDEVGDPNVYDMVDVVITVIIEGSPVSGPLIYTNKPPVRPRGSVTFVPEHPTVAHLVNVW